MSTTQQNRDKMRNIWILQAIENITGVSLSQLDEFAGALAKVFEYGRYVVLFLITSTITCTYNGTNRDHVLIAMLHYFKQGKILKDTEDAVLQHIRANMTVENALTIITTTGLSWKSYKQWVSLLGKTVDPESDRLVRPLRLYDSSRRMPSFLPSYEKVRDLADRILTTYFDVHSFQITEGTQIYNVAETDITAILEYIYTCPPLLALMDKPYEKLTIVLHGDGVKLLGEPSLIFCITLGNFGILSKSMTLHFPINIANCPEKYQFLKPVLGKNHAVKDRIMREGKVVLPTLGLEIPAEVKTSFDESMTRKMSGLDASSSGYLCFRCYTERNGMFEALFTSCDVLTVFF